MNVGAGCTMKPLGHLLAVSHSQNTLVEHPFAQSQLVMVTGDPQGLNTRVAESQVANASFMTGTAARCWEASECC